MWLTRYLQEYENAFILISHDIPFLNSVVNIIYHMDGQYHSLDRYVGDYDKFQEVYEMKKAQRDKNYDYIVNRMFDVFRHCCNVEVSEVDVEASRRQGSSVVHEHYTTQKTPIEVNVIMDNQRKKLRFPDATGRAFLDVELGVTKIGVSNE